MPYDELIKLRLEDGIDPTRKEDYLTEEEFAKVCPLPRLPGTPPQPSWASCLAFPLPLKGQREHSRVCCVLGLGAHARAVRLEAEGSSCPSKVKEHHPFGLIMLLILARLSVVTLQVFGMSRDAFKKSPQWRQIDGKKKVNLF